MLRKIPATHQLIIRAKAGGKDKQMIIKYTWYEKMINIVMVCTDRTYFNLMDDITVGEYRYIEQRCKEHSLALREELYSNAQLNRKNKAI